MEASIEALAEAAKALQPGREGSRVGYREGWREAAADEVEQKGFYGSDKKTYYDVPKFTRK